MAPFLQDTPHTLMPAAPAGAGSNCRQPPDFMLATLVGNGAAWSVATLPAIKLNSHPSRRLVKVPLLESLFWGGDRNS